MLPGQRRQRHDPSRSFPVDLRCQHGSTRFTQVGLPFPVLQGSPRWFLTCQKPPERPPVHSGPSGIIPVHHGGTTVQPPVLPGSPRSMDRGEPGSTGSPVGLGHIASSSWYGVISWGEARSLPTSLSSWSLFRQSSHHIAFITFCDLSVALFQLSCAITFYLILTKCPAYLVRFNYFPSRHTHV